LDELKDAPHIRVVSQHTANPADWLILVSSTTYCLSALQLLDPEYGTVFHHA